MATRQEIARQYTRMQLQTAGHPRIIWMMHAKAVQFIRLARQAQDNPVQRKTMVVRAQNLLAELEAALKITDDVSRSLFILYDYCYSLLDLGTDEAIDLAVTILSPVRDGFALLLKKSPILR